MGDDATTGLRSGDPEYRAYVGGPGRYDVLAAAQFGFLVDAGLRDDQTVLDVGCGSLRLGRLLIPWLRPGRYHGVEPNAWLVQEGFERELGDSIREIKRPSFLHVDDFSVKEFGVEFDYVMAYSVLTHCYEDLTRLALERIGQTLAPRGLLLGTFVENHGESTGSSDLLPQNGSGWLYPKCVRYTWEQFEALLDASGLAGYRVYRPTPHRQSWFVAARADRAGFAHRIAHVTSTGERPFTVAARAIAGGAARKAGGAALRELGRRREQLRPSR